jgi:hypothetical protein
MGPFAKTLRTPEIVGVIESVNDEGGYGPLVTIADGQELALGIQGAVQGADGSRFAPLEFSGNPRVGDLVIAGRQPSLWYTTVVHLNIGTPEKPNECYLLDGSGTENADSFDFDYGLRLTKASDFDPLDANGHDFKAGLCLDVQARVKSVVFAGG